MRRIQDDARAYVHVRIALMDYIEDVTITGYLTFIAVPRLHLLGHKVPKSLVRGAYVLDPI